MKATQNLSFFQCVINFFFVTVEMLSHGPSVPKGGTELDPFMYLSTHFHWTACLAFCITDTERSSKGYLNGIALSDLEHSRVWYLQKNITGISAPIWYQKVVCRHSDLFPCFSPQSNLSPFDRPISLHKNAKNAFTTVPKMLIGRL